MTKNQIYALGRIIGTSLLFLLAFFIPGATLRLLALALAYAIIGYDVLWKALCGVLRGQMLDENFLMGIASLGAFFVGEAPEAVAVMLFYQIGELFQNIAVGKSRNSISSLLCILPEVATLWQDGKEETVPAEEVQVGQLMLVRPGEKIPLDGEVITGFSELDTASLTGESLPRAVKEGDAVYSGTINLRRPLVVRCTKPFSESAATKILELVENSEMYKAKTERFITRFARYYTPIVVLSALALALLPPLFLGIGSFGVWKSWIHTALIFLIVSCPCALVISVPMAFFGGIGGACRKGILIKGANHLEMLSRCETVVFDKTGTLTKGSFSVVEIHSVTGKNEELLQLAATAEQFSNHPIALCLKQALETPPKPDLVSHTEELSGAGVMATLADHRVLVGNASHLKEHGISVSEIENAIGSVVYVAIDETYLGYILVSDTPKEDAKTTLEALKTAGVRTVLLTGDRKYAAQKIQHELGLDEMHAELHPEDKVTHLEKIQRSTASAVAFVGDGINDAPVLARADVGIAMGALGQDAAIESADIVLVDDRLASVPTAIAIAKKTMRIVRQNVALALGVKLGIMLLDLLVAVGILFVPGMAMTWIAVFGDVGVAAIAILNALRTMHS